MLSRRQTRAGRDAPARRAYDALVSGSDYAAISSIQVVVIVVAALFALIGGILLIDGRGGPEELRNGE
jgi:hypothetical protein